MTDITQYTAEQLKEITDLLPPYSIVGKIKEDLIAANVMSYKYNMDRQYSDSFYEICSTTILDETHHLYLGLSKDTDGTVLRVNKDPEYLIEEEAKKLYRIAEPHAKHWLLIKETKRERYRRIARHNSEK